MVGREQDIRVWSIQRKEGRPRPYVVRWVVDRRSHSRSHRTKAQAERFRSRLLLAQQEGQRFAAGSGEPEAWAPSLSDTSLYAWAREWVGHEWDEWAPRTRDSTLEALARFVPLVVGSSAPAPPAGVGRHLKASLRPGFVVDGDGVDGVAEAWLRRWVLSLGQLDESLLARVDRELGVGLEGQALAANTSKRYRRTARSCVQRAVELKLLSVNPWPPAPKGRSRRKVRRQSKAVDVQRLPSPSTMVDILEVMVSHQPSSRMYQTMTAVAYYGGLRPSEVIMLRRRAVKLAGKGWGRIDVVEVDDGYDEPADPKTGVRPVPIPPQLVSWLSDWLGGLGSAEEEALLFRTRNDKRPTLSNWRRSLQRACALVESPPLSPYDCRHACATTWLQAGVPLGEAALRLGHSVETLVTYYVGALQGDDAIANERISSVLDETPRGLTQ